MTWMELSVDTTHEAIDWVCTLLAGTDYAGDVNITRYTPKADPDWAFTLRLHLPYSTQTSAQVEAIASLLSPLQRTGLTTALQTALVDQHPVSSEIAEPLLHPIGERFVVVSPDLPPQLEAVNKISLKLGSSFAFGSGLHPATVLSLRLLERHVVPSMNVLDLGSGSGILSVAIAKLGASVLALDNDSIAVQATQDAVQGNGVGQQVTVIEGSLGRGSHLGHWMSLSPIAPVAAVHPAAAFDLIVANILARVHIALAPDFQQALRCTATRPGLLITAGYTRDREDGVCAALQAEGFDLLDCERQDEWVALVHQLPATESK